MPLYDLTVAEVDARGGSKTWNILNPPEAAGADDGANEKPALRKLRGAG